MKMAPFFLIIIIIVRLTIWVQSDEGKKVRVRKNLIEFRNANTGGTHAQKASDKTLVG